MSRLAWVFMFLCAGAFADHSSEGEFQIDPNLLGDLYQGQIKDVAVESRYRAGGLEIEPSFSYLSPTEFSLKNNYFTVPYGPEARIPLLRVFLSTSLYHAAGFTVSAEGGVGYGYREAVYDVPKGTETRRDLITNHLVPLSLGVKLGYSLPFAQWVKPIARVYGGANWLQQAGRLDGITQAFWIPFYSFSGGINVFDLSASGTSWFGGVTLSATKSTSTGTTQAFSYSTLDLSATLVL